MVKQRDINHMQPVPSCMHCSSSLHTAHSQLHCVQPIDVDVGVAVAVAVCCLVGAVVGCLAGAAVGGLVGSAVLMGL